MIESSIGVKRSMDEINLGYAKEIEDVLAMIQRKESEPTTVEKSPSLDLSLFTEAEANSNKQGYKSGQDKHNSGEHETAVSKSEQKLEVPAWAKKLWKGIAKKSHPDILTFEKYSALEIAKRQQWFLEARNYFENSEYHKMLHIGLQLEIFVEDISFSEQTKILDNEYNTNARAIEKIQGTLAWKWGNNWHNVATKVAIIEAFLTSMGKDSPGKDFLLKIIAEYEME